MILPWLIVIPAAGAVAAWLANRVSTALCRWTALAAMGGQLALVVYAWAAHAEAWHVGGPGVPLRFAAAWIPPLHVSFLLMMDGLSLLMVALTAVLGILSVAASWRSVVRWPGLFHFNLLWSFAAITGVFLAEDLFLFYVFWEMMLIPLYLLIRIWGHERRRMASMKFFLFTQTGGLLLLGILALHFLHARATGVYTFRFPELAGTAMSPAAATWLMLAFFAAFAVKLPAFGVHTWLADAHTQAPVAGSVDLAGLVLKVGAYGMLRFVVTLFPGAAADMAPYAMALGVAGIVYGALLATAQSDLKRLVAYSSISHMGFVLLGVFSWDALAMQGTIIVIVAHGISTGALFVLVGMLHERLGTHDMRRMGGLWAAAPGIGGAAMVLALATLGLPGLGNFVGEWLVLQGTWRASPAFAAIGTVGFVLSAVYALRMVQLVFFGPPAPERQRLAGMSFRETAMMAGAIALLLWLGLYPRTFLRAGGPAVTALRDESLRRAREPRHPAPAEAAPPGEGAPP